MKIITICILYFIVAAPAFSQLGRYDRKLSRFIGEHSNSNEIFKHALKNFRDEIGEGNIDLNRLIPKEIMRSLSVSIGENAESVRGLFFVSEFSPEWEPYSMPFGQWGNPAVVSLFKNNVGRDRPDQAITIGDNMMPILSALDCSVVELYDASFSLDQMKYLNGISTLQVLAFPVRGMKFDRQFMLPKGLKFLVVRNCELTNHFFSSIRHLEFLEILIISNCTVTVEDPVSIGFSYEKYRSFEGKERIFMNGLSSLKKLVIEASHPNIFNYLLPETWPSLEFMEVDVFSGNMDAVQGMFHKRYYRETFPRLNHITIHAVRSRQDNIRNCLSGLEGVESKVIMYPWMLNFKFTPERSHIWARNPSRTVS